MGENLNTSSDFMLSLTCKTEYLKDEQKNILTVDAVDAFTTKILPDVLHTV